MNGNGSSVPFRPNYLLPNRQCTDFIKSSKHRNGNHLVACADCHEPHGKAKFAHQMKRDSNSPESCTTCHNTRTMQTGADMGKGMTGKDGKNYWVNDITSHLYDIPRKDNIGVKDVESGKAMPIPYTNSCGAGCHNTSAL